MRVVISTIEGDYPTHAANGLAIGGRCPVCCEPLLVEVGDADSDAVCESCGAVVGRVYVHAIPTRQGVIASRKADGR